MRYMKQKNRLLSFIMASLLVLMSATGAFAVDAGQPDARETAEVTSAADPSELTEVTEVGSVEELSAESSAAGNEAFFTLPADVDAAADDTGEKKEEGKSEVLAPDHLATEELKEQVEDILDSEASSSEKQSGIAEALDESGFYTMDAEAAGENEDIEVVSKFANQRLRLVAECKDQLNAYGAVKAVYYDDHYLLSYESMEATKLAYEALCEEYGEENVLIDIPIRCCDTTFSTYWGYEVMGMQSESEKAASGEDVTVAILDSGIDTSNSAFTGKTILQGYDYVNGDKYPVDDNGHGTNVSALVASFTPDNVKILPVKILDSSGNGSMEDLFSSMEYADKNGADIMNMSIGGMLDSKTNTLSYYEKVFSKYDELMVCASGNSQPGKDLDVTGLDYFPAELDSTVCVASFDEELNASYFANYGDAVDFAAPQYNLAASKSGTSYATAYVTAAAAIYKAENSIDRDELRDVLTGLLQSQCIELGDSGKDDHFGYGCPTFAKTDGSSGGDLSENTILTGMESSKDYTGSEIRQDVILMCNGAILQEGTDYTISYADNINVGTASMTVTGTGNYTGSFTRYFSICQKVLYPSVKLSKSSYAYTGKVVTPAVTVKDDGTVLEKGVDYDVSYSSGRKVPGTYTVTVKLKGNYSGSGSAAFTISKAANGMKVKTKTVKVKSSKLRKSKVKIKAKKAIKISGQSGSVTYKKKSGSSKLKISKKGKITVKKNTKKGNYKMKVKVKAAGDSLHSSVTKTVTVTVRVK